MEYIAFDAHKHYTLASVARPDGRLVREQRLPHERGALQQFRARCEPGSPVAVETIGNWYWIVDEIEAAGCVPKLVQPCSRTRTCTTSPLSAWLNLSLEHGHCDASMPPNWRLLGPQEAVSGALAFGWSSRRS
jgi:hypothetical protein